MPTNTKKFSWKLTALLCMSVGLLTATLSIGLQVHGLAGLNKVSRNANTTVFSGGTNLASTSTTGGAGSSFQIPALPVRLLIPSIGVDAHIQSVGLGWKNTADMGVPTNFTDVAWYNAGPLPGMPGSAVIDGHLDGKTVPEAVFYNLDKLKPGDIVEVVDKKGNTLRFVVVGSKIYDYDAPTDDIFSNDTSTSRLNLITCAGDWDKRMGIYSKRIVVFTELASKTL